MANRTYGDYSRLPRMPELRMLGVTSQLRQLAPPESFIVDAPGMTCFYYLRAGAARFYPDAAKPDFLAIEANTSIAIEDGKSHKWMAVDCDRPAAGQMAEILSGSVDRLHTAIQKLTHVMVVMRADAEPFASIVRHCVDAIVIDLRRPQPSDALVRRLSEVIQLELLHYADTLLEPVGEIPDLVRRDAALLRAWTSFLADPAKPWTIASLAEIAGISRTAFFGRFHKSLGLPPVAMIRRVRIHYAAEMLRSSAAPITEIALRTGYGSDIALARAFRKEMGTTPAKWRRVSSESNTHRET